MNKKRKVDEHLNLLKESILIEQELLHDAKIECFVEIQKMVDMLKSLEKHLEVASQIHRSMESLQAKIEELEEYRNSQRNVPKGLLALKPYDIKLHSLATHECQELASKF